MSEANSISIVFFGALRETLATRQESLTLTEQCRNIRNLRNFLAKRGGNWTKLLNSTALAAVNHQVVGDEQELCGGDEVAFFPPVTGG